MRKVESKGVQIPSNPPPRTPMLYIVLGSTRRQKERLGDHGITGVLRLRAAPPRAPRQASSKRPVVRGEGLVERADPALAQGSSRRRELERRAAGRRDVEAEAVLARVDVDSRDAVEEVAEVEERWYERRRGHRGRSAEEKIISESKVSKPLLERF